MADNSANLRITGSLDDSFQSAYQQARAMLDDLAARAALTISGGFSGFGGGGGGGAVTAAPGAAASKARVTSTVTPSLPSVMQAVPQFDMGAARYRDAASGRFVSSAAAQQAAAWVAGGIVSSVPQPASTLTPGGGDNGLGVLARAAMVAGNPSMAAAAMAQSAATSPNGPQSVPNPAPTPGMVASIMAAAGGGGGYTPPPSVMAAESDWWNGDRGLPGGMVSSGAWMSGVRSRFGIGGMWGMHMMGTAAIGAIDQTLNRQTHDIMAGRPDILGNARAQGSVVGGVVGGGIGLLASGGNPFIAGMAAAFGSQLTGSVMERFAVGDALQAQTATSLLPAGSIAASIYRDTGHTVAGLTDVPVVPGGWDVPTQFRDVYVPGSVFHANRMRSWVNTRKQAYDTTNAPSIMPKAVWEQFRPTEGEISATYSGMEHALLVGGINPESPSGAMNPMPKMPPLSADQREIIDRARRGLGAPSWLEQGIGADKGLLPAMVGTSEFAIVSALGYKDLDKAGLVKADSAIDKTGFDDRVKALLHDTVHWEQQMRVYRTDLKNWQGSPNETVSQMYSRRLLDRFLRAAPEVQAEIAPAFESLPETRGNMADIVERFGPQAAYDFASLGFEKDKLPPYSVTDLFANNAKVRGARAAQERGALQIRGAGYSVLAGAQDEADAIAALPGGTDSTAYLRARRKMQAGQMQAYHESDVMGYELPLTSLRGERERMDALPFAPGNVFRNSMQTIQTEAGYLRSLRGQEADLRGRGLLSEDDELRYRERQEGLLADITRQKAQLTYGVLDRLPGEVAGMPTGIGRFNSDSLTALNLGRAGFGFVASAGAVSGRHARFQQEFASSLGAGDSYQPQSRTQGLNNGGNGFDSTAIVNKLDEIRRAIERGNQTGGGSARPANNMASPGGLPSHGAQTPFN